MAITMLPNLSPSPNLYKVQNVNNKNLGGGGGGVGGSAWERGYSIPTCMHAHIDAEVSTLCTYILTNLYKVQCVNNKTFSFV